MSLDQLLVGKQDAVTTLAERFHVPLGCSICIQISECGIEVGIILELIWVVLQSRVPFRVLCYIRVPYPAGNLKRKP